MDTSRTSTGSTEGSSGSFESSLVRYPCRTVCNLFWGNSLASRPFTDGDIPISFPSLWPDVAIFTDMYRESDMGVALPDIVRLLLATRSYPQLEGLQRFCQLSWEQELEQDKCSLIHMVCALNCDQLLEAALTPLRQAPKKELLARTDSQGRTPVNVCFTAPMRKLVKKNKAVKKGQQLTPEVKRELFSMAGTPAGLYQLALTLQTCSVNIDEEKNEEGNHLLHVAVTGGLACLPNIFLLVTQYKASVHQTNEQGLSPLCLACQLGEEKLAEVLLCVMGASVNAVNPRNGWTPLHYSAHHNQPALIRMLLTRGADFCSEDNSKRDPSFLAQQVGATECEQILAVHSRERADTLAQQAFEGYLVVDKLFPSDVCLVSGDGHTLLMKAVLGNHPTLVRALVNNDHCPINFKHLSDIEGSLSSSVADQPLKTAVTFAATNGFNECLQILLDAGAHPAVEDGQRWLPLHYACQGGHYKCVKTILDHPKGKGLTRLTLAISLAQDRGNTFIVTLLRQAQHKRQQIVSDRLFDIALSGDQNELFELLEDDDSVNPLNETSDWPILIAAGYGHLEIIKMLHKQGGHIVQSHKYNMNTPLHTAARGGHLDVVRYLLNEFCPPAGVTVTTPTMASRRLLDINDRNLSGATPLELAAEHGHMPVIMLLLDHGAVTTLPDCNNQLLSCKMFCGIQFLLENRRREQLDKLTRALVDKKPLKEFSRLWQGPSDFNHRDAHWNTVLMIAARHANKLDVLEYLLQSATHYTSDMMINYSRDISPEPSAAIPDPIKRQYIDDIPRPSSVDPAAMMQSGCYGDDDWDSSDDDQSVDGDHNIHDAASTTPTENDHEGPCTQSGIVCLVNSVGYTALHCAVDGKNHKTIPLLLQADPLVANIQDKNGKTALHLACHLSLKRCVKALLRCRGVMIDCQVKDISGKLAEELCVNGRLKKKVMKYRIQQIRKCHPARKPHPPTPHPPHQYEETGLYNRVLLDHRGHRRCGSDVERRGSPANVERRGSPADPQPHHHHHHDVAGARMMAAQSPLLSAARHNGSSVSRDRPPQQQLPTGHVTNLRQIHYAHTSDDDTDS